MTAQRDPSTRVGSAALVPIALQLALVLALVHVFGIQEDRGLPRLTALLFLGFLGHALAPRALRPPLYLALSLAAFVIILGPLPAALVVALGLALVGLCHLPLPYPVRVLLVAAAGAGLALGQQRWMASSLGPAILILESMFMFRMIVYLYDIRHEKPGTPLANRLSYFFLLPNCLFPFFPIVDYKTYVGHWYKRADTAVYQKGVQWMARGIVQILLYRLLYRFLARAPADVHDLRSLAQYLAVTWLLYLRVTGLFHFIVGSICLFGFDLPATNNRWLLASGFNDLWRRANIYWKDFMMKVFYYPLFMRLRRRGETTAMVVATAITFLISWILHSYQWFWLRGDFPLTLVDTVFWTVFAALVITNSLLQAKFGRSRASLRRGPVRWRDAAVHSLKVVGMFSTISVMWSFYSSESIPDWVALMATGGTGGAGQVAGLGGLLAGIVALGTVAQRVVPVVTARVEGRVPAARRGPLVTLAGTVLLLALGLTVRGLEAPPPVLAALAGQSLNQGDKDRLVLGYYEHVLQGQRGMGAIWETQVGRPPDWLELAETDAVTFTGDVLEKELKPDVDMIFKAARLTTNRFGMRDQDYPVAKPAGAYRMALMGGSPELGAGVTDDQVFESIVEAHLNADYPGSRYAPYEILNFSVSGYSLLQQVATLERKALRFAPDTVLVMAHNADVPILRSNLRARILEGVELEPGLVALLAQRGIKKSFSAARLDRMLQRMDDELMGWAYTRLAELCRAAGARAVWVFVPLPGDDDPAVERRLQDLAERAGFLTLTLDAAATWGDRAPEELVLRPWDRHPNALAQALLAAEFERQLVAHQETLELGLSAH